MEDYDRVVYMAAKGMGYLYREDSLVVVNKATKGLGYLNREESMGLDYMAGEVVLYSGVR